MVAQSNSIATKQRWEINQEAMREFPERPTLFLDAIVTVSDCLRLLNPSELDLADIRR